MLTDQTAVLIWLADTFLWQDMIIEQAVGNSGLLTRTLKKLGSGQKLKQCTKLPKMEITCIFNLFHHPIASEGP
jgi:hypothetical protein